MEIKIVNMYGTAEHFVQAPVVLQRDERKALEPQWKWRLCIGSGELISVLTSTEKCTENFEVLHMKTQHRDTGVNFCRCLLLCRTLCDEQEQRCKLMLLLCREMYCCDMVIY